jgi:beta-lactamase regulating signal transducer with metallopeptidase domain
MMIETVEAVRIGAATLARSVVVIGVGAIMAGAVGRRAARVSWIWTLVFFGIAALPALSNVLPAWNLFALDVRHATLAAERGGVSLATWACSLWGAGAALLLVRLVRDVRAAHAVAERACEIETERLTTLIDRAMHIVGGNRRPVALETSELASAGLIGWRRPRILLPAAARAWSDDELLGVLCHELEHARRDDWLMLIVERTIVALFWINPLVFFAARSAAGAREIVADDAVARAPIGLDVYAGRLIASARLVGGAPSPAAALGFASGVRVDVRIHALFEARRDRRPVSVRSAMLNIALALPIVLMIAAAQPWGCVPESPRSTTGTCP